MKPSLPSSKVAALLCASAFSMLTYAQKSPDQVEISKQKILSDPNVKNVLFSTQRQTPSFIQLDAKKEAYSKAQAKVLLERYLEVNAGEDAVVPDKVTPVFNGIEVLEFQQYFKGIKVEHAKFKALSNKGVIKFFNGSWYDVPSQFSTAARINKVTALGFAKQRVKAKKYATDELTNQIKLAKDINVKQTLEKELQAASPKGDLVIVKDFTKAGVAQLRLAYKFDIYAAEPISRDWIYIDAQDGRVLLVDPIIKHANPNPNPIPSSVTATVQTRYAGNRNIYVKQISGMDPVSGLPLLSSHPLTEPLYLPGAATWVLMDDTRGGGIETYDMNGVGGLPLSLPALYLQGKSFTDVDNNWTLSEHKRGGGEEGAFELENDDIAWDAHWGAGMVYDYWKKNQNRLSFDGKDSKIKSFIHYGPAYDNAFWNGSVMTYGDGSGTAAGGFKALTSLDVCGHEIGHGVTEYTANLVYEKESGAMNEGFSDIWAACVEHYVISQVDPSLGNIYRPFYIGEQIGATLNDPLRRMDNPKAKGNPDTYGGVNFDNPDCSPDLTNDYCGVHNNSGLLNKWFYLMTIGSGAGSGPDARYAMPDSDDGINDLNNTYSITGLGFTAAERIAYLTELMLHATSTFAEAREASIVVATELSGNSCSPMVEAVTNSWYAVGVGEAFVKPCTVKYGFILQPGAAITEGTLSNGCAAQKIVSIPVLLPANSSATVSVSGTATTGQDYTITTSSLTNTTGQISKQNFDVVVKNDAVIEGDENVVVKISIANAGTNPVNNTYTLTLLDDDVTPIIGEGEKQLLSETFTRGDGFADPAGWTEVLEIAEDASDPTATTGFNQWGVFNNQLAITGREGVTGLQLLAGTYNPLSESKTYIKSPLIDARGLSLIRLKFNYTVQGEMDPQSVDLSNPDFEKLPVFDYMAVMYSLDGANWVELNSGDFKQFASVLSTSGSINGLLPVSLANKQFYLAFRWYNDTNAGGPESVKIDNVVVTGSPRKIENEVNHSSRENLGAGQEVYFYSVQDGEVLGKIKNGATKDYGCTGVFIEKGGSGSFNLYQSKDGLHKVIDKVVRIETSFIYKAATTVTLHYTEAQLQTLELATGKNRTAFSVYLVDAAAYTGASAQNTKRLTPLYSPIPGVGGTYTITVNDKVNGSYAVGCQVSFLGLQQSVSATSQEGATKVWKFEDVYPNPAGSTAQMAITAPQAAHLAVEIVNASGVVVNHTYKQINTGKSLIYLNVGKLITGNYLVRIRDEKGMIVHSQTFIKR